MDMPACIRLPFLRPLEALDIASSFPYLSPGHLASTPGYWKPDNYPLSCKTALAFLESLEQLSLADIETMRTLANGQSLSDQLARLEEMAALDHFAGRNPGNNALEQATIEAQKLLLWRWHQEERLKDLSVLESACNSAEAMLPDLFGEKDPKACMLQPPIPDNRLAGSWKAVVANAAFFIPANLPVLAEAEMASDLAEILDFMPAEASDSPFGNCLSATAPLWEALGGKRPIVGPAATIYNMPRIWLIEINKKG